MVKNIHHVGIVVESLAQAYGFWRDALGLPLVREAEIADQGVRAALLAAGDSEIELLEPTRDGHRRGALPRQAGRRAASPLLRDAGRGRRPGRAARPRAWPCSTQTPRQGLAGRIAFLNPSACHGVLVELATPPPDEAPADSPVRFKRLVIGCRDPQDTAKTYQQLFGLPEVAVNGGPRSMLGWAGGGTLLMVPASEVGGTLGMAALSMVAPEMAPLVERLKKSGRHDVLSARARSPSSPKPATMSTAHLALPLPVKAPRPLPVCGAARRAPRRAARGRSDTVWLVGLCAARAAGSTMAMAYPAVLSVVQKEWGLSLDRRRLHLLRLPDRHGLALVFVSALADYSNPRVLLFRVSAGLTAAVSLLIPVLAHGHLSALLLFGAAAVAVAGIYTPGIMLLAERFEPARRGRAVGWFLAASSMGYVGALVVGGAVVARAGLAGRPLRSRPGASALLRPVLALFRGERSRRASAAAPRRVSFDADLAGNRPAQLMIWGYVFHSWELLGMWAWTPAFIAAALVVQGTTIERAAGLGASLSAIFHVMGIWPRPRAGHCPIAGGAPRSSRG